MPISPEKMKLYPGGSIRSKEWLELRETVRERAQDACEGSPAYPDCRAKNGEPHPVTRSIVVCTTAHLEDGNHDPEQLRFWCQRCHNTFDLPSRRKNASKTIHDRKNGGAALNLGDL